MSRREGRDSHGKRLHPRSEREHSPMKPRRDGKLATERTHSRSRHSDIAESADRDQKQHKRLQDTLLLEVPAAPVRAVQHDTVKEDLGRKADGLADGTKHSSDAVDVPQSQSYFQHDERDISGQGGRSFGRRSTDHGRWSDAREQYSSRARDRGVTHELQRKYERTKSSADDKKAWRHDRFYDLEAEAAPPPRKRPAFSEKKMPTEPLSESMRTLHDRPLSDGMIREERGAYPSTGPDKFDKPLIGVDGRRGDGSLRGPNFQSRGSFRGGFTRGRDRIDGRYSERSVDRAGGSVQVDKWKHDLFDEANRSPTPKNEEEQIAKVEALLAL